jgi:DNA adenine methylase
MELPLSVDQSDKASPAKPFLRWAGSKRKLVKALGSYWCDTYDRYVEPFAGSACLFLDINPDKALLADKNRLLIETYEMICQKPSQIYDAVKKIPRTSNTYYKMRELSVSTLTKFDRAVRFIYLNRNCFNGIYRTNRQGKFNVPFASDGVGAFITKAEFLITAERFRKAELRAWDFGTTLRYVQKGDFVYLDPPYVVESRRVFREYSQNPFTHDDLARLHSHLEKIHKRGATFVVSYADCKESRSLGSNWNSKRMRVRRHIAGFGGARKAAYELLITNT